VGARLAALTRSGKEIVKGPSTDGYDALM